MVSIYLHPFAFNVGSCLYLSDLKIYRGKILMKPLLYLFILILGNIVNTTEFKKRAAFQLQIFHCNSSLCLINFLNLSHKFKMHYLPQCSNKKIKKIRPTELVCRTQNRSLMESYYIMITKSDLFKKNLILSYLIIREFSKGKAA